VGDVAGWDAHSLADAVQAGLVRGGGEEGETAVGPFFADIGLRLEARTPVDRSTATESLAGNDGDARVVWREDAAVGKKMDSWIFLCHWQIFRSPMICLFDNNHPLAGFSKVFGADAPSAAAPNYHDIGLENLGLVCRWKLNEAVVEPFTWLSVHRGSWKS